MFAAGLKPKEIHNIYKTDLQIGKTLPQKGNRAKTLHCCDVASARHYHIRLTSIVIACPLPNPYALRAVCDGGFHVEISQVRLLVGNDHIHVVHAAETMVYHTEQTIRIRR